MTDTLRVALRVEVWSDVVCPWCYIGKRRFEAAVASLGDELQVDVVYRAFQLDPAAPAGDPVPVSQAYARKFGGPERAAAIIERVSNVAEAEGLDFRLDRALRANTFDAHRLLWLALQPGSSMVQTEVKERLLRAYFSDGLDVGDRAVLADLAAECGADRDEVSAWLDSEAGATEVRAEVRRAHELAISGVPAYLVAEVWTVPGAQDPDVFVQVLRRARDRIAARPDTA